MNKDADMLPTLPEPGGRQWFVFAMKDPLPLGPQGWGVVVHQPECGEGANGPTCLTGSTPCFGTRAHFVGLPHVRDELGRAIRDMSQVLHDLGGTDPPALDLPIGVDAPGALRWIAAASTVVRSDDAPPDVFARSFEVVVDAVAALRNATGAAIPDPTIERMQPLYLTAHESLLGPVEPTGVVIVEHGWSGPPLPATVDQLEAAEHFLVGRWRRSPIEAYRGFALQARQAIWHDGDYMKGVLTAAIACEVLIKNAAWMLTFEAGGMAADPTPGAHTDGLGTLRPAQLIGRVLQPRLGGGWASGDSTEPVGAWRFQVGRARSDVLHRGRRPSAEVADDAATAMGRLETHVADRIAARADIYPRTAYVLVGPSGLDRRGRLEAALAVLADVAQSPEDWIDEYVQHLDGVFAEEEPSE